MEKLQTLSEIIDERDALRKELQEVTKTAYEVLGTMNDLGGQNRKLREENKRLKEENAEYQTLFDMYKAASIEIVSVQEFMETLLDTMERVERKYK